MRHCTVFALAVALVASCASEEITQFPRSDTGDDAGADTGADTRLDAADADGDVDTGPFVWVGRPCTESTRVEDCGDPGATACIDREFLNRLGVNESVDLPGGICSRLLCSADADCGPQGLCFDTEPFTGESISICLRQCVDMIDCRWEEGYDCLPLDVLIEGAEGGACVSDSIQAVVLCEGNEENRDRCEARGYIYGPAEEAANEGGE